jgi:hypothetical protein
MPAKESKKEKAREVIDILQEISVLLVRLPNTIGIQLLVRTSADVRIQEHSTRPNSAVAVCITDGKWGQSRSSSSTSLHGQYVMAQNALI